MLKTIVLATDGSDNAKRAADVAAEMARDNDAKLVFAHVDERITARGDRPPPMAEEDQVQDQIRAQAAALADDGVETSVEIGASGMGGPCPGLLEIADTVGADVIVTGTRGHSSLAGVAVGSVTHKLLHLSKRPVLVVPPA